MLVPKLAYRNLIGAGLKTWLKVVVLSLSYVLITWHFGFFNGMYKQASRAMIEDEIAGGQYWHKDYDPYDSLSLDDAHGVIPKGLVNLTNNRKATPVLIRQASIYPNGRIQSILLKGIDPEQTILNIPTNELKTEEDALPILIGKRMSKNNSLETDSYITIRWRDAHGTFDAIEGRVVKIMTTQVPTIDAGQLWVPLNELQKMTALENEATMVIVDRNLTQYPEISDWAFRGHDFLLEDVRAMVRSKKISAGIMYFILVFLAMLAIFDTQILSIFRRRKEIGTLMALGMTRRNIVALFTLEGAIIGILAIGVGLIYGTPLIYLTATKGIALPEITEEYGFAISTRLFPVYSLGLVLFTVIIIMTVTIIVSYLPTRKISRLKPTEALKGKI